MALGTEYQLSPYTLILHNHLGATMPFTSFKYCTIISPDDDHAARLAGGSGGVASYKIVPRPNLEITQSSIASDRLTVRTAGRLVYRLVHHASQKCLELLSTTLWITLDPKNGGLSRNGKDGPR